MSVALRFALSTDGPFDRVLKCHIEWALQRLCGCSYAGDWIDPRTFNGPSNTVAERLSQVVGNYTCNLLFIHRDSEQADPDPRYGEIIEGRRLAGIGTDFVAVVPVRMTEAWLLIDESAIRTAAGKPRGRVEIPLPALNRLEQTPDPKLVLENCLVLASEKRGRRLEIFKRDLPAMKHRVAELIEDYEPLLEIPSFRRFYEDLEMALRAGGMGC